MNDCKARQRVRDSSGKPAKRRGGEDGKLESGQDGK